MEEESVLRNIIKIQDDDGHWYWIPGRLLSEFENELEQIISIDYMDNPEGFDSFINKYDRYRTLGSPDNMPDFFKS